MNALEDDHQPPTTASVLNSESWNEQLRTFVAAKRAALPIPTHRAELSDAEEAQRLEVGNFIVGWLEARELKTMLMIRHSHSHRHNFEPRPTVIFTSTMPGLVAASHIFHNHPFVVYMLQHEYKEWISKNPDDMQLLHVHMWNYFLPASQAGGSTLLGRGLQAHPDANLTDFYIHHHGSYWGAQCGEELRQLWKLSGDRLHQVDGASQASSIEVTQWQS